MAELGEVTGLHVPDEDTIAELRKLLADAEAGRIRGMLFVVLGQGNGNVHYYGRVGEIEHAQFALGVKMLEIQLSKTIGDYSDDAEGIDG